MNPTTLNPEFNKTSGRTDQIYHTLKGVNPGPPWKPEGFGFPYDESNRDPPCQGKLLLNGI